MFFRKKKEKQQDNQNLEESLANFAVDKFLKRDQDYTVVAEVEGAVLIKKEVKWAYCDIIGKDNIQALFSIRTDKGLFCFQVRGKDFLMIDPAVCTAIYPQLV